jgi:hypothetical protein
MRSLEMTPAVKIARKGRILLAVAALVIPLPALAEQPSEPVPGIDEDRTLSEQLDENKGVIVPPPVGDAEIHAPAPEPLPGTTPVIPPPGTPGGDPSIQPK